MVQTGLKLCIGGFKPSFYCNVLSKFLEKKYDHKDYVRETGRCFEIKPNNYITISQGLCGLSQCLCWYSVRV